MLDVVTQTEGGVSLAELQAMPVPELERVCRASRRLGERIRRAVKKS